MRVAKRMVGVFSTWWEVVTGWCFVGSLWSSPTLMEEQ